MTRPQSAFKSCGIKLNWHWTKKKNCISENIKMFDIYIAITAPPPKSILNVNEKTQFWFVMQTKIFRTIWTLMGTTNDR